MVIRSPQPSQCCGMSSGFKFSRRRRLSRNSFFERKLPQCLLGMVLTQSPAWHALLRRRSMAGLPYPISSMWSCSRANLLRRPLAAAEMTQQECSRMSSGSFWTRERTRTRVASEEVSNASPAESTGLRMPMPAFLTLLASVWRHFGCMSSTPTSMSAGRRRFWMALSNGSKYPAMLELMREAYCHSHCKKNANPA